MVDQFGAPTAGRHLPQAKVATGLVPGTLPIGKEIDRLSVWRKHGCEVVAVEFGDLLVRGGRDVIAPQGTVGRTSVGAAGGIPVTTLVDEGVPIHGKSRMHGGPVAQHGRGASIGMGNPDAAITTGIASIVLRAHQEAVAIDPLIEALAFRMPSQAFGGTAPSRHGVDIPVAMAVTDEGEAVPIWRPLRASVVGVVGSETLRPSACDRSDPEVSLVTERDLRAIWRKCRMAWKRQLGRTMRFLPGTVGIRGNRQDRSRCVGRGRRMDATEQQEDGSRLLEQQHGAASLAARECAAEALAGCYGDPIQPLASCNSMRRRPPSPSTELALRMSTRWPSVSVR